jgi:Domain of unknown function (DUF5076)
MNKHSLPIPPAATRDPNAVEMIRCWVAEKAQWTSINGSVYENRGFDEEWAWGLFLVDTVRHLSNSISLRTGKEQSVIEAKILEAFQSELSNPTSSARGGNVG